MINKRVYAEIDLSKIRKNVISIRNAVGNSVKIMASVKADGYGHGAIECARAIDEIVDAFAVATIGEAIELRESGFNKKILVLGYVLPEFYSIAIKQDISLTVFSYDVAKELNECALKCGGKAKIHIAIETGMGRIGFYPDENSINEIAKINSLEHIEIEGVFSHFATADNKDKTYSKMQIDKYMQFVKKIEDAGVLIKNKHISNSAAVIDLPEVSLDMVRVGIILYGLYPSDEVNMSRIPIEPAMSLKSKVVHIKTLHEGESVSYGRQFIATKETKVATVSAGYADGYPRLLSNKGRVIINGQYANIIGNVCMDQLMVDVTHIKNIEIGNDVILMGKQNGLEISAEEIAHYAGTINYEIVCGINKRVPRVYVCQE